jgi:hypothetical protein
LDENVAICNGPNAYVTSRSMSVRILPTSPAFAISIYECFGTPVLKQGAGVVACMMGQSKAKQLT